MQVILTKKELAIEGSKTANNINLIEVLYCIERKDHIINTFSTKVHLKSEYL